MERFGPLEISAQRGLVLEQLLQLDHLRIAEQLEGAGQRLRGGRTD